MSLVRIQRRPTTRVSDTFVRGCDVMANDRENPTRGYKFFRERARDGKSFSIDELETASGWSRASIDASSKQGKDLLAKADGGRWTVAKRIPASPAAFLDHISQKRPLFSRYSRKGHEHYVMFEFLLPLTRESQLRAALDDLFYSDTVEQRLREIGVAKLAEVVTRNNGETAEAFYTRVVQIAACRFGRWSCPKLEEHHDHAPHQEQAEAPHPELPKAGSTGGGSSEPVPPMPFVNSTDNSAQLAHQHARRMAQARVAQMNYTTSPALLLGSSSSVSS